MYVNIILAITTHRIKKNFIFKVFCSLKDYYQQIDINLLEFLTFKIIESIKNCIEIKIKMLMYVESILNGF